MSVLDKLTEGIAERSLSREGDALIEKWESTGLLEGIEQDTAKNGMARLLENQAAQLLKEASSMAAGDVQGFAAVAFPLVRRVFGSLLANDLVSVQPMSLPSGLIFFMDFTYNNSRFGVTAGESVYGGGVVASQLTGGVSNITEDGGGFYNLQSGYSSPSASLPLVVEVSGAAGDISGLINGKMQVSALDYSGSAMIRWDPDVLADTSAYVLQLTQSVSSFSQLNRDNLIAISGSNVSGSATLVRRLTQIKDVSGTDKIVFTYKSANVIDMESDQVTFEWPIVDNLVAGNAVGSVTGTALWGLEGASNTAGAFDGSARDVIPELDIKVDSVAVTAKTKKLKAKWTPELGQDLNAYHNLDAEVELTQILSEQIALEIDREILNDLIQEATAGTYYWSRSPGLFVNRTTGQEIGASAAAPDFTGTVSEWYETLVETMNDVSAQIHRKTLRGGANFVVTSPEVANILEFTAGFRANVTADSDRGTVGAVNVGSLSKKFDLWVDPYFPRNLVLVGRKGGSFLESGYVYAPYVPLQVTPTIFGTEDFVPRKGVMTRYAKKMVRPDMYGLVVVEGLLGQSGGG
jgi:hypothetical protein